MDIGLPDVNFGLVRLGESCTREVPLVNSADIPVTWTISECIDYCMDRTLPVRPRGDAKSQWVMYTEFASATYSSSHPSVKSSMNPSVNLSIHPSISVLVHS